MSAARNEILDDELTRITPGLRPFSVGILRLARKLGLKLASGGVGADPARETLTMAWLLDERNPLDAVRAVVELPEALQTALDEYEFQISPAFLVQVQQEISRTSRAVEAASVTTVPKPGDKPGPAPPPNSSSQPG
jgi:hypothetical protein